MKAEAIIKEHDFSEYDTYAESDIDCSYSVAKIFNSNVQNLKTKVL